MPLAESDLERFGPLAAPIAGALRDAGELAEVDGRFFYTGAPNPAVGVSLRHMSDNTFSIVLQAGSRPEAEGGRREIMRSSPTSIASARLSSCTRRPFICTTARRTSSASSISRARSPTSSATRWTTTRRPCSKAAVRITQPRNERDAAGAESPFSLAYGDVDVTWQTVAFKKIKFATRENIGLGPVDIPAQKLATTAFWLCADRRRAHADESERLRASEGLVGLRNLAVVALPLVAMCDSRDLGGVVDSTNLGHSDDDCLRPLSGRPRLQRTRLSRGSTSCWRICHEMVADCPCEEGCPSCVGLPNLRPAIHSDPDLTRGYPMPNKRATMRLLELLREERVSKEPAALC